MTWGSPEPQSCVSVQRVNQTHSIYPCYSLLTSVHACSSSTRMLFSIAVDPFKPPGTSLVPHTHTKGISDHQQDESRAAMALFQRASVKSSGSGQSPAASVPIFCLSRSSGLKGGDLWSVNTISITQRFPLQLAAGYKTSWTR